MLQVCVSDEEVLDVLEGPMQDHMHSLVAMGFPKGKAVAALLQSQDPATNHVDQLELIVKSDNRCKCYTMHVCIHVYVCACVYIYIYIHTYIHTCICIGMYVCIYIYSYIYIYIYSYLLLSVLI